MKEDDKPQEESKRLGDNRSGFSDPTPALPEGEGVRFEANESVMAIEANSLPTKENLSGVNKPVTSSEADSLPTKENLSGVNKPVTSNEADSLPTKGNLSEVNNSVTSNEADSLPTKGNLSEVNNSVTSCEADSLPTGEGWGGVQKPGYITANPYTYPVIKDYRKDLKDHQTKAELVLWEYLRNKKTGHKIRRQHVIDDFITDFVCLSKKVIIEIDGEIHKFQQAKDNLRTIRLNSLGYEVIRFTNNEVLNAPGQVAQKIKNYLNNQHDSDTTAHY